MGKSVEATRKVGARGRRDKGAREVSSSAAPVGEAQEYQRLLESITERVKTARVRAAMSVNRELVLLYWEIGREILARQVEQGWGAKVIDVLSQDLRRAFPATKGLSTRNLKYMKAFAEAWPEGAIVQQLVAQIPWGHNVRILDKVSDPEARLFYVRQTVERGWSRSILELQLEASLFERQGRAITNFDAALPSPDSDLARQTIKDPYCFDFLSLAGKVNFYLAAVDDLLRHPDDRRSIGLLLCAGRDRTVVEYALSDTGKPMGVAGWSLTKDLPEGLAESLPSVELLERELQPPSDDANTDPLSKRKRPGRKSGRASRP